MEASGYLQLSAELISSLGALQKGSICPSSETPPPLACTDSGNWNVSLAPCTDFGCFPVSHQLRELRVAVWFGDPPLF